jgi:hypothetical protein
MRVETTVETLMNGEPLAWKVAGIFKWGEGPALCPERDYPLSASLGPDGYRVVEIPQSVAETLREGVAHVLNVRVDELPGYHDRVSEAEHMRIIDRSRELRFADLGLDPAIIIDLFEPCVGVKLSPTLPALGRDHVQLRINRPGSTDYNPPHRDAALPVWANSLNIWLPIAGVDEDTSLGIVPGSHRIAESDCWQTTAGGAFIGGKPYRVPAIAKLRQGPLPMIRAPLRFGEALLFTPYLIHGLAVNNTQDLTRMALEFRFEMIH